MPDVSERDEESSLSKDNEIVNQEQARVKNTADYRPGYVDPGKQELSSNQKSIFEDNKTFKSLDVKPKPFSESFKSGFTQKGLKLQILKDAYHQGSNNSPTNQISKG